MDRGFSDEAIVGVKSIAVEDAVTYQRIKLSESGSNAGAGKRRLRKGGTCYQNRILRIDVVISSALGTVSEAETYTSGDTRDSAE